MENLQEVLQSHSISEDEYKLIVDILKREPNFIEIGIFSAMWSEHCSYKSSKKYLKGFPISGKQVIQGPGENAGIIDIGDGLAAVFKIESHNHPSFIEPFEGATTGVGGIMRDIFTMGAKLVANLNSIYYGEITNKNKDANKHKYLINGSVAGIAHYGNCMGVPTIGGSTKFDDCYNGNILINAFSLGIVKKDKIFYAKADEKGSKVLYIGNKTGKDGLGGAVMSSNSFEDCNLSKRPTVQVGDPFTQKLLVEACLEIFEKDLVLGIQDMGAAGLASSSFEMAYNSKMGMKINIDNIPCREENMNAYHFMLSESQERMLLCAKDKNIQAIKDICKKWNIDASEIGEIIDGDDIELYEKGEKVASIPIEKMINAQSELDRAISIPKYLNEIKNNKIDFNKYSNNEALRTIISSTDISDKAYIYEQYDSTVQTNTIKNSGSLDASCIGVMDKNSYLSMSVGCNPRACYINPKIGSAIAVATVGREVVSSGARPLAITDCLNFGNPKNPEVMWQFKESCEGIKQACASLNTPVVSGNVSLYNETNTTSIYPTPSIAVVGLGQDKNKLLKNIFSSNEDIIYYIGDIKSIFSGSVYAKVLHDTIINGLEKIDYIKENKLWDLILGLNDSKLITASKECSSGGIAINIAKMSAISGIGADITVDIKNNYDIFAENQSAMIICVNKINKDEVQSKLKNCNLNYQEIGQTNNKNNLQINDININIKELQELYFNSFKKEMQ
jgi:phosphoribosylformylglycinamidine synthase